jgi:hypothetical protein
MRSPIRLVVLAALLGALGAWALDEVGVPNPLRVYGDLTVSGQTTLDGYVDGADAGYNKITALDVSSHAASGANAYVAESGARLCLSGASCGARWTYDGAFIVSPVAVSVSSTLQSTGDMRPLNRLINSGTAATCTSNTGAVCIDDAGGLAVADGNGTTSATISAAGAVVAASVNARLICPDSKVCGSVTIEGDGSTDVTINNNAVCQCTNQSANSAPRCSMSGSTLTATGTAGHVFSYFCPTTS